MLKDFSLTLTGTPKTVQEPQDVSPPLVLSITLIDFRIPELICYRCNVLCHLLSQITRLWLCFSVADSAEILLRSPRKIFIFIIKKYICKIKVPKQLNKFNFEQNFTALRALQLAQLEASQCRVQQAAKVSDPAQMWRGFCPTNNIHQGW